MIAFTGTTPDSSNVEFAFRVRSSASEWHTARAYSPIATWNWDTSGLATDTYYVGLFARNIGSNVAYEVSATPISYVVNFAGTAPAIAASTTATVVGDSIFFQAYPPQDLLLPINTRFSLRSSNGEWTTVQGPSANNTFTWDTTNLSADTYYVTASFAGQGSSASEEVYATPMTVQLFYTPLLADLSLSSSHASVVDQGTVIQYTANSTSNLSGYEFQFEYRAEGGDWIVGRDYATSPIWNWDTSTVPKDRYHIKVKARDEGSQAPFESTATPLSQIVNGGVAPTYVETGVNKSRAVPAGESVVFSAISSGGTQAMEYMFRMRTDTGEWETVQGYSNDDTWSFDTTTVPPGYYYVGAYFRALGSTASFDLAATPLLQQVFPAVPVPVRQNTNAVITIAAYDAPLASRNSADYVAHSIGAQAAINAAINALPAEGGIIQLSEGTFSILGTENALGGIVINRSNVILQGRGISTRLLLADNQNTNVIRIIGDGLANVTVRNLYIHGNRANNYTANFEGNGIKAQSTTVTPMANIEVSNCFVEESARLNIMIDAVNARIIDNRLGDSTSDSVEILTGPGLIQNNYAEIDDVTGYVLSTDQADDVTITNNIVKVLSTGTVTQSVIRTWGGRMNHVISNNQVIVYGRVNRFAEINNYLSVINGNIWSMYGSQAQRPLVELNGGTILNANILLGLDVVFRSTSGWPSTATNNLLMSGTTIRTESDPVFGPPLLTQQNNLTFQ